MQAKSAHWFRLNNSGRDGQTTWRDLAALASALDALVAVFVVLLEVVEELLVTCWDLASLDVLGESLSDVHKDFSVEQILVSLKDS